MTESISAPHARANAHFSKDAKAERTTLEAAKFNDARLKALSEKTTRLRALRLARDAAAASASPAEQKAPKRKRPAKA